MPGIVLGLEDTVKMKILLSIKLIFGGKTQEDMKHLCVVVVGDGDEISGGII